MLVSGDNGLFLIGITFTIIWLNFPDLVPESTGIESIAVTAMESHTLKLLKFNFYISKLLLCTDGPH